jgi:hypothetical protein
MLRNAAIAAAFIAILLIARPSVAAGQTVPPATIPPVNGVPTYCEAWSAVSLGEVSVCLFIPQLYQSVLLSPDQIEPPL